MLIIRRRPHESVLIGPDVEIRILDSSAGKVTLGILAPREVRVLRKEIQETFEQNREAAGVDPAAALPAIRALFQRSDPLVSRR